MVCVKPDFKTSTGVGLKFRNPVSQEFERIPERNVIYPQLRQPIIETVNDLYKTTYKVQYGYKFGDKTPSANALLPYNNQRIHNGFGLEVKMFNNPPKPLVMGVSEMKSQYIANSPIICSPIANSVENIKDCRVISPDPSIVPGFKTEDTSFVRWLDPYLTDSRASYVAYTREQQDSVVGRKDVYIYYDCAGYPKCHGFGMHNPPSCEPLLSQRIVPVYDKLTFKSKASCRILPKPKPHALKRDLESEYKFQYTPLKVPSATPIMSIDVDYTPVLSQPAAYQTLAAPGMYMTDYNHIGSGYPISSVVDPGVKKYRRANEKCKCLPMLNDIGY